MPNRQKIRLEVWFAQQNYPPSTWKNNISLSYPQCIPLSPIKSHVFSFFGGIKQQQVLGSHGSRPPEPTGILRLFPATQTASCHLQGLEGHLHLPGLWKSWDNDWYMLSDICIYIYTYRTYGYLLEHVVPMVSTKCHHILAISSILLAVCVDKKIWFEEWYTTYKHCTYVKNFMHLFYILAIPLPAGCASSDRLMW